MNSRESGEACSYVATTRVGCAAQATAATYELKTTGQEPRQLKRREESLLRWTNPLGGNKAHGELFLWTDRGRPAAVLSMYEWTDVKGIVLTHGDSDHTGFAERLRSELGIPVYVGRADAARAQGEKPPSPAPDARRLGPMLQFFAYAIGKGGVRMPAVREVVPVDDGDVLDLPGAPRVIAMPGHSPGSIARTSGIARNTSLLVSQRCSVRPRARSQCRPGP